jgi:hypothetical protein
MSIRFVYSPRFVGTALNATRQPLSMVKHAATRRLNAIVTATRVQKSLDERSAAGSFGSSADFYISDTGTGTAAGGGSFADPWPITMLGDATAGARAAGNIVQIQNGTYSTSGNAFTVHSSWSGTLGNYTVLRAELPRQVIFEGFDGSTYPAGIRQGIVVNNANYIEYDGFEIKRGVHKGFISDGYHHVTVRNCEIHDLLYSRQSGYPTGDNIEGVRIENANDILLSNLKIYDISNGSAHHNSSGIKTYSTTSPIEIEYCTIYGTNGSGIFLKEANSRHGIVRNCYDHGLIEGAIGPEASGATGAYYNNVFYDNSSIGFWGQESSALRNIDFYNNTVVNENTNVIGATKMYFSGADSVNWYNNIVARLSGRTSGSYGDVNFGTASSVAVADYNRYPSSGFKGGLGVGGSVVTYSTLPTWQSALGGLEAASSQGDPSFTLTGTGAERFKLQGGSSCINAGRVGGVSGGGAVNQGAYSSSGQTEQIGCDW